LTSGRVTPNGTSQKLDIVGGSTFGKYSKISAAKTFNMYVSSAGIEGSENQENWMVGFPGYHRVLNLLPFPNPYPNPPLQPDEVPAGAGRGIFYSVRGNFILVVVNSVVYRLSPTLGQTTIGPLNTSSGEVFMAENLNSQICIVDGQDAWVYQYSATVKFEKQTDGALATGALVPNYVEYHNTFFLFGNGNTSSNGAFWYVYQFNPAGAPPVGSLILQLTVGGQFALQTKADSALAVKRIPARSSNVLVFGKTVCEVWTQTGGVENYTKNPALSINYGCQSVSTIAGGAELLVWLGINEEESPVICAYDGAKLQNISTDGIDKLLGSIRHPETSTAMLYREDGHLFYILTFYDEQDNLTLMYDFNTGLFSNLTNQDMNFHPARGIVYFNLKTYFISLRNAALYEMDSSITYINENLPRTNAQSPYNFNLVYEMQQMRITSNIRLANSDRFVVNGLNITLEQGCDEDYTGVDIIDGIITETITSPPLTQIVTEFGDIIVTEDSGSGTTGGLIARPDYTPRIDLRFSKDGGVTWSNYVSRSLHALGYRQNILHWEGMGATNDICFCFRYWAVSRIVLNNGIVEIII